MPLRDFQRLNRPLLSGRFERARRMCIGLLNKYPNDPRLLALKARLDAQAKIISFDEARTIVRKLISQNPGNERLLVSAASVEWASGNREVAVDQLRDLVKNSEDNAYVHETLAGMLPFKSDNRGEAWQNYQVALRSGPLSTPWFKSTAFNLARQVDPEHADSALAGASRLERAAFRTRAWGFRRISVTFCVFAVAAVALELYGDSAPAITMMSVASVWAVWMIYANDRAGCLKCRDAWFAILAILFIAFLAAPHDRDSAEGIALGGGVLILVTDAIDLLRRKVPLLRIARRTLVVALVVTVLVLAAVNSHAGIYQRALTSSIRVKGEIDALSLSPNGRFAYLVGVNQGTISAVNLATQSLSRIQIRDGANVTDVAVSPNGKQIYVTDNGGDDVYVLNSANDEITGTIAVGGSSAFVAFSPDGQYAFVGAGHLAFQSDQALVVVDVATQRVVGAVPVGAGAEAVAVNPNGRYVYVASGGTVGANGSTPSEIQVISVRKENVVATFGPKNSQACGLALNPKGSELYASFCSVDGTDIQAMPSMEVINTATNKLITHIYIAGGSRGVVVSPNGQLVYTALDSYDGLGVINAASNSVVGTIPVSTGSRFASLNLLSINSTGRDMYSATVTFGFLPDSEFSTIALKGAS